MAHIVNGFQCNRGLYHLVLSDGRILSNNRIKWSQETGPVPDDILNMYTND